tara:strand:+ start:4385 stop:5086 length:702 start_codon:yes stop_codon:yes gene_type:complete
MKKYIIKYTFEFIVIVLGISVSFLLEDARQKKELKYLSQDLVVNLLNEVSEIESYLKEREVAIKGDKRLLDVLRADSKNKLDSLLIIEKRPKYYGAALFNYRGFKPPVAFYNSMVNDGKIRYLESTELKKTLDLMHNVHFYFIDENVEDEAISQRKVMDYFQVKYPNIFVESENSKDDIEYVKKIEEIVSNDEVLKAILYQKAIAMQYKIVGFNRYKKSLSRLKDILLSQITK